MTKFIIGIGSQRAGSTLVHKILDECTPIFMHPVKELHYYDTLFNVRNESVLKEFSNKQINHILERVVTASNYDFIDKKFKCYIRANKILSNCPINKIDYIDLYRPCIAENNGLLGEVTPEYMILPEEAIIKMRDDLGKDTKIILLAREPVARFISAFKLLKLYGNQKYDMANFEKDLEETMKSMPGWMQQQDELNDYESSLNQYRQYFNNVLFLSFEQLVSTPETVYTKLSEFLQVDINKERYLNVLSAKVNDLGDAREISPEIYEILDERYSDSKKFLNNIFMP